MGGYIGRGQPVAAGGNSVETEDIVDGAVTADKLAPGAVATTFPFYKADGSSDTIAITSGAFPFYKSDGSLDNIGVS